MPVLSSVQRGDIGPATGAIRLARIVIAFPVAGEICRKLKAGYGWPERDDSWLVSHPYPSPFSMEDVQSEYRGNQTPAAQGDRSFQRLSLFTPEWFEARFKSVPRDPLRFIDNGMEIWGQKIDSVFEPRIGRVHTSPGQPGSWLVQFYEPGRGHNTTSFDAMQFAVEDEKFLWTHFRAQI